METSVEEDLHAWKHTCAHVTGAALGSSVAALRESGALDELIGRKEPLCVDELQQRHGLVRSYTHLTLLLLCTQGLLVRSGDVSAGATQVLLTRAGRSWAQHANQYDTALTRIDRAIDLYKGLTGAKEWSAPQDPDGAPTADTSPLPERIQHHLRGPEMAAVVTGFAQTGALSALFRAKLGCLPLDALPFDGKLARHCVDLLVRQGWARLDEDVVQLTLEGRIGMRWNALYGYVLAYLPIYRNAPRALGVSLGEVSRGGPTEDDRKLLLRGKSRVFTGGLARHLASIIAPIFNENPLDEQPRLLLDLSVGEGRVLSAAYNLIASKTQRGARLSSHPLTVVGVAGSPLMRDEAAKHLEERGIAHHLFIGDAGDPDSLAQTLRQLGLCLTDALVISKTHIHARTYQGRSRETLRPRTLPLSEAVFIAPDGAWIDAESLEDDLAAFFWRWSRWTGKHGLIAVDSHTVAPEVAARTWEHNAMTHFLSSHGYSHQLLIEADRFREAASRGGLRSRASRNLGNSLVAEPTMSLDHFVV